MEGHAKANLEYPLVYFFFFSGLTMTLLESLQTLNRKITMSISFHYESLEKRMIQCDFQVNTGMILSQKHW